MIFDFRIYVLVGIFIIICISLMLFNSVIIHYSRKRSTPSAGIIDKWKDILYNQAVKASDGRASESKYEKFLLKKLSKTENLIAYSHALQYLKSEFSENYSNYIEKRDITFKKLADRYSRKSNIERTYFTNFIYNFPQVANGMYGQLLMGKLISYIDKSTVHCRTAVLRALCNIGNAESVVNALLAINDRSLFVHSQILTNALSNFRGDKEILMGHLWSESQHWNENILISIIQFITRFSNSYNIKFLPILRDSSINSEVRIATIRYYGENIFEPARLILNELATNSTKIDLATEAASALQQNESPILIRPGIETNLQEVLQGNSNDTREKLAHMLGLKGSLQGVSLKKEKDGEKLSA